MNSTTEALVHHKLPWWVHPCRTAWVILRFFWGTVVVGLLLDGLASLIFVNQSTNLQTLLIGHILNLVSQHILLIVLLSAVMVTLTILAWIGSRQEASHIPQIVFATPAEGSHVITQRGGLIYRAGYKGRYLRYLSKRHDSLDVSGLPTQLEQGLELLPVFVELCLVNKPVQRTTADPIKPPETLQDGR